MSDKYINPSGFAENLPNEQLVEDELKKIMETVAERYGYIHLETASVEYMDTLASKGDVNKEIYSIGRALSEGEGSESERGLHFDLTVPFARYVAQNQGQLEFPFRRYQIQKVWRGERPQKGRFREFYQADIDVVANENLPIHFDAEIATVMARVLDSFEVGKITMHINNRKFLNGLIESLGVVATPEILQAIDKVDKVGVEAVKRMLVADAGVNETVADTLFTYLEASVSRDRVSDFLASVVGQSATLEEGKSELLELFNNLPEANELTNVQFVLNPKIARGLDYYTGTVFETTIDGLEKYGSICSGGRYADLASRFTSQKLPGVGLSIGLTRLLAIIKEENLKDFSRRSKTQVVVCLPEEERRTLSRMVAEAIRSAGFNVEQNQKSKVALGKQLDTAEQKGIPYALVCELDGTLTLFEIGGEKKTFGSVTELTEFLKFSFSDSINYTYKR